MSTNAMLYPIFLTEEQLTHEKKSFFNMILKSIQYYVLLKYKTSKNLDCYDIEQICLKIKRYETYIPEISYLKNCMINELTEFSSKIKETQFTKSKVLNNEYEKAQSTVLKLEILQKKILIQNILSLKWPFDKKYNEISQQHKTAEKKLLYLERQLDRLLAVRAYANQEEIQEFCKTLKNKYKIKF